MSGWSAPGATRWFAPDHLLAIAGGGFWGAQWAARRAWLLPVLFVGVMLAGGSSAMLGCSVPAVRSRGILPRWWCWALFLLLGPGRYRWRFSAALVSVFACPCVAHGAEMPLEAKRHDLCPGLCSGDCRPASAWFAAGAMVAATLLWPSSRGVMGAVLGAKWAEYGSRYVISLSRLRDQAVAPNQVSANAVLPSR